MLEWLAMEFLGSHILSIDQFERTDIEKIFTTSDSLVPYAKEKELLVYFKVQFFQYVF